MGSGNAHDFMVRTDDGAIGPIFPCQSLDDLVCTLAALGVDYLQSDPMFPLFGWSAMLPAVEHDSDRVMRSMPIGGQIMQQLFSVGFNVSPACSAHSQQVIPIDDHMRRHSRRYREALDTVKMDIERSNRCNS